jgi:hypothetical protein
MIFIRRPSTFEFEFAARRLFAAAMAGVIWLSLQGLTSVSAQAQVDSEGWKSAIVSLTSSDGQLASVTVPAGVLEGAQGSASYNFSRANLMLFAADVAKYNQFPGRSHQLYSEAEKSLLAAQQVGLPALQGSQCAYLLGFLSERVDNNLQSAATFYQQALSLDATNKRAVSALARVEMYLARESNP